MSFSKKVSVAAVLLIAVMGGFVPIGEAEASSEVMKSSVSPPKVFQLIREDANEDESTGEVKTSAPTTHRAIRLPSPANCDGPSFTVDAGGIKTGFINCLQISHISEEEIEAAVRESVRVEPVPGPACGKGDVNGDASVDIKDAILILQILDDIEPQDKVSLCGDVNNDGKIGLEELTYVLRTVGA